MNNGSNLTDYFVTKIVNETFAVSAMSMADAETAVASGQGTLVHRNVTTVTRVPEVQKGVGTELHKLLLKFRFKAAPGCNCVKHAEEMNQKGVEWCSQNIDTIVGWLREEAQRAKLPFTEIGAKIIVKRAIHNAKKKLTPAATA